MRIIDATWEKRNLGVIAKEINIDIKDTATGLEQIRGLDFEYSVVRVPVGCVEIMCKLEDMGYHYIETLLDIQHNHKNISFPINNVAMRIMDSITYAEMSEVELTELWNQIKLGVFETDRVSLDPAFSQESSANRFICWIGDEITRGGKVYKCVLNKRIFGFFVNRIDTQRVNYVCNLGIYKEYENAGLGMCLIASSIRQAIEVGARKSISAVSTNNISAIKANLAAGYQITSARYIYTMHKEESPSCC